MLVTGMSGAGKSTLLDQLAHRGHASVATDYGGWVLPDGLWDETRMATLLGDRSDLVVSGTVSNQGLSYDRFEHVVLLSAPRDVLIEGVRTRRSNSYGHTAEERSEITGYIETVEPQLRHGATLELDGRRPVGELADIIELLLASDR